MIERCEKCGMELKEGEENWLELDQVAGRYRLPGEVDEDRSQGLFPFGPICKIRVLQNGGKLSKKGAINAP